MKKLTILSLIFLPFWLSAQDTLINKSTTWKLTKGHQADVPALLQINPTEGTFTASNVTLDEILQTAFQLPAKRRIISEKAAVKAELEDLYSLSFKCPDHRIDEFESTLQEFLRLSLPVEIKSLKKKEKVQVLRKIPGSTQALKPLDMSKPVRSAADLVNGKFEGFNMSNLVAFLENYLDAATIDRSDIKEFVQIQLQIDGKESIKTALKEMGLRLVEEDYFATYLVIK